MILKMILSPDDVDSVDKRIRSLIGPGWVTHYRVSVNPKFYKAGSKYDYYWEGGFWNDDKHFDDIVLHLNSDDSLIATYYVETQEDRESEEAALSDAQSLLEGLPRP